MNFREICSILLGLIVFTSTARAAFSVPDLTGPVIDQAGVLDRRVAVKLDAILREANHRGKLQLQILIVKSLNDTPIEQASIQITDKWQLGKKEKDNGILFLVAINDRQMRIEVGQGLEGDLPDIFAKRIIEDDVMPYFKSGDYASGVSAAVKRIIYFTDREFYNSELIDAVSYSTKREKKIDGNYGGVIVIFLFMLILFLRGIFVTRHGWSGGGWSGGGGGFSGGGASGRW